jgi:hypothetical protein
MIDHRKCESREKEGRDIKIIDFGAAFKLFPGQKVMSNSTTLNVLGNFLTMSGSGYSPFLDENDDQDMHSS